MKKPHHSPAYGLRPLLSTFRSRLQTAESNVHFRLLSNRYATQ